MIGKVRVEPGAGARFDARDPGDTLGLAGKEEAHERLAGLHQRLGVLQQRLHAEARRSVLLVLQGLDASGKDGVIRTVFAGANPLGIDDVSFRVPEESERAHDYLWRIHRACPRRGDIGVFNRSHYEDVVTVRMLGLAPEEVIRRRPRHIREFERLLVDEGTELVKVFLHVSKEEQRERLQERVDDPEKRWKFRAGDLEVRRRFEDYMAAYDEVIGETSTEWAPWHVVPADRNWVKSLAVAHLLVDTLERMDPQLPPPEEGSESIVVE